MHGQEQPPNIPTPVGFGMKYGLILGLCYGALLPLAVASAHFFFDSWRPGDTILLRIYEAAMGFVIAGLYSFSFAVIGGVVGGFISGAALENRLMHLEPDAGQKLWRWGLIINLVIWLVGFLAQFAVVIAIVRDVEEAIVGCGGIWLLVCIGPGVVYIASGAILAQIYYRRYIAPHRS